MPAGTFLSAARLGPDYSRQHRSLTRKRRQGVAQPSLARLEVALFWFSPQRGLGDQPRASEAQASAALGWLARDDRALSGHRSFDGSVAQGCLVSTSISRTPSGHKFLNICIPRAALTLFAGPGLVSEAPLGRRQLQSSNSATSKLARRASCRVRLRASFSPSPSHSAGRGPRRQTAP